MVRVETNLSVVDPPSEEPVTLAEVKAFARIDVTSEDALIQTLIKSARRTAENIQRRALVTQTLRINRDGFPSAKEILLPRPPLQSVSSIEYKDVDGSTQTMPADDYQVDAVSEPGRIWLAPDASWPATQAGRQNAVSITFIAGYGAGQSVPETTKVGIMALATWWLENRDEIGSVPVHIVEQLQCDMFAWVF